jgi:hypothetical protein
MNWQAVEQALARLLTPADTSRLQQAVSLLQAILPATHQPRHERKEIMTSPTDLVSISQSALNAYAASIEAAIAIIKPYIASLVAGQTPQLSAADVTALAQAVTDIEGLEPPAPTPAP